MSAFALHGLMSVAVFSEQWVRSSRRRATAAVGSRERFENMPVGIFEVDPRPPSHSLIWFRWLRPGSAQ